jgi:hypothetical protein
MRRLSMTILAGQFVLLHLSSACGQPLAENRVDRWNNMWMNQTGLGMFGNQDVIESEHLHDPCSPAPWAPQCELPGGSEQQYLYDGGIWIGAIIVEEGQESYRVSTAMDHWSAPLVHEFWSAEAESVVERSRHDTINCFGDPIGNGSAIADHEFSMTFTDTLTDPLFVGQNELDGPHRPLGVKITRTSYSMLGTDCQQIYWIKYHVENIGSNYIRNLYFGYQQSGGVGLQTESNRFLDDLVGFDATDSVAYVADNDGRPVDVSSGTDFTVPNVLGCMFLNLRPDQHLSFNWWVSDSDTGGDFGPAWTDYADLDSMGLGWTHDLGTPASDERKYQLLGNGELDYDQVFAASADYITSHPQDGHAWHQETNPQLADIGNGTMARFLLSVGPYGIYDYTDEHGRRIYRLNPGESFDVWMAMVGGLNFHDAQHPQPTNTTIDPTLFNLVDLRMKAQRARDQDCVPWALSVPDKPRQLPGKFALDPVYPNPFNATTRVRLSLDQSTDLAVKVFDILGREVQTLARGRFVAGSHELIWNAVQMPAGIYFIEARTAAGTRQIQKAILLK